MTARSPGAVLAEERTLPDGTTTADPDTNGEASRTRYAVRKANGRRPASVEFDDTLYWRLHAQAGREQRAMAAIVRIAVGDYLDKNEPHG